jgi:hypothetical protein
MIANGLLTLLRFVISLIVRASPWRAVLPPPLTLGSTDRHSADRYAAAAGFRSAGQAVISPAVMRKVGIE